MTTVLLFAHADFASSRANRALLTAVSDLPEVEIANLYGLYPDGRIDAHAERERLFRATRLVLQFPLQWYSTPALLKEWLDTVLTPLFYLEPRLAEATAGLPLFAATTTGGPSASYRESGAAGTLDDLFSPLRATARKCRWIWQKPFAVHDVRTIDDEALLRAAESYRAVILAMPILDRRPPHEASA